MLDLLSEEAQGKSLGERSSLMAEKWTDLSIEEKRTYEQRMDEVHVDESKWENVNPKDRRGIMMRIAKHHQADVSFDIIMDQCLNRTYINHS